MKFLRRLFALALCAVLIVSVYAIPKARASLVGAGAAAVGAAALAAYMAASGLSISSDSAEVISTGLDTLAGDFLADSGSTETTESWFTTIGNMVTVPGSGILQLPASVVRIVGGFVDWLTETFGLTEEGSEGVVIPGRSETYSYGGYTLQDIDTVWTDKETYPYALILFYMPSEQYRLYLMQEPAAALSNSFFMRKYLLYTLSNNWTLSKDHSDSSASIGVSSFTSYYAFVWSNHDVMSSWISFTGSTPIPVGTFVGHLGLTRGAGFTDIVKEKYATDDIDDDLKIITPGAFTSVDTMADAVLGLVAAGDLTATYELTQESEGTEEDDETAVVVPGTAVGDITIGEIQAQERTLGTLFMSKFPFSIPWDLAAAVQLMAAPAETPYWELDFYAPIADRVGGWKGDTSIVIDMGKYELVGQVCRWVSTVLFVGALITGTKRLIWTA